MEAQPLTITPQSNMEDISYMALVGMRCSYKFKWNTHDKADLIIKTVCDEFRQKIEDVTLSKRRNRQFCDPRQIAIFLVREHTTLSLKEIGFLFGNRDHTTVIHSCNIVRNLMQTDEEYKNKVKEIEVKIE